MLIGWESFIMSIRMNNRDLSSYVTSKVFKEMCKMLEIKQNIASMYHPQTDRQSKKTNQHVETTLQIFGNFWQDNWSELLPVVQYQLNLWSSTSTKQTPYETWMGFVPRAHQPWSVMLLSLKTQIFSSYLISESDLWSIASPFPIFSIIFDWWCCGLNLTLCLHPNFAFLSLFFFFSRGIIK
jgi:hypothetical protein